MKIMDDLSKEINSESLLIISKAIEDAIKFYIDIGYKKEHLFIEDSASDGCIKIWVENETGRKNLHKITVLEPTMTYNEACHSWLMTINVTSNVVV